MEAVGRGSAVDNLPVDALRGRAQVTSREPLGLVNGRGMVGILICHLQKPLHTAAAVLWALAIIAVREQNNQASLPQPLGLPT